MGELLAEPIHEVNGVCKIYLYQYVFQRVYQKLHY